MAFVIFFCSYHPYTGLIILHTTRHEMEAQIRLRETLQTSVQRTEVAYWKVYNFWCAYGVQLQSENGSGTFNYDFIQKMGQLHPDIVAVMDKLITGQQSDCGSLDNLQSKIGDILSLQRRHITQFQFCLDEFNRYLTSLCLLQCVLQHRELF